MATTTRSFTLPGGIRLDPHPTARNKATAAKALGPAALVASIPPLSTCLLPSEKGRRCDGCHHLATLDLKLRKCSGCASYWYCGTACQTRQWKAHHKRICKGFNRYTASSEYQALSQHDQVDAVLLSQLLAEVFPSGMHALQAGDDNLFSTFCDLLKSDGTNLRLPPVCGIAIGSSQDAECVVNGLYARFGNNNFVLHSHLTPYAHGIFPLASRLFNHSCVPNAIAKYIITPSSSVHMEIITLRAIDAGEEITIPYLDPALPFHIRQQALQSNYGFTCSCFLCIFTQDLHPTLPPSRSTEQFEALEAELRKCIFGDRGTLTALPRTNCQFLQMPPELYPLLHESYLPDTSEVFSRSSHDGQHKDALAVGLTLLALYVLLYPCNYPQIGMHLLEMAKTAWNAAVVMEALTEGDARLIGEMEANARLYLRAASQILSILGSEGDAGGPLEEIRTLQGLLDGA